MQGVHDMLWGVWIVNKARRLANVFKIVCSIPAWLKIAQLGLACVECDVAKPIRQRIV